MINLYQDKSLGSINSMSKSSRITVIGKRKIFIRLQVSETKNKERMLMHH